MCDRRAAAQTTIWTRPEDAQASAVVRMAKPTTNFVRETLQGAQSYGHNMQRHMQALRDPRTAIHTIAATAGPALTALCDDLQHQHHRLRWSLNYQLRLRFSERLTERASTTGQTGTPAPPMATVRGPRPGWLSTRLASLPSA